MVIAQLKSILPCETDWQIAITCMWCGAGHPAFQRCAAYLACASLSCILSAAGEPEGPELLLRFFAPWAGIDEDPVTGLLRDSLCVLFAAEGYVNMLN